jgi:hypothetical protein
MSLTQNKTFKLLLGPVMLFSALLVSMYSLRVSARILLVVLIASYVRFLFTSKTKWLRLVFVAFLITAFLPIDISFQNYPGPPRFVPLIMGLPNSEDFVQQERGEVMLGGCIVDGNEPKWVLVW